MMAALQNHRLIREENMFSKILSKSSLCLAAAALSAGAVAQDAPMLTAQPVAAPASGNTITLPANTAVTVRMNEELTTRRNREGDTFYMSVATDVVQDGYVIIPAGSRAVGTITWLTKKGAFGKSGKMDISINSIEVGSTRIPVVGSFRQEGEGNTVATVGAVVLVGVFGAFVTGRSGVIPSGRELQIHTRDPLTVSLPAGTRALPALTATVATPGVATTETAETPAQPQ